MGDAAYNAQGLDGYIQMGIKERYSEKESQRKLFETTFENNQNATVCHLVRGGVWDVPYNRLSDVIYGGMEKLMKGGVLENIEQADLLLDKIFEKVDMEVPVKMNKNYVQGWFYRNCYVKTVDARRLAQNIKELTEIVDGMKLKLAE